MGAGLGAAPAVGAGDADGPGPGDPAAPPGDVDAPAAGLPVTPGLPVAPGLALGAVHMPIGARGAGVAHADARGDAAPTDAAGTIGAEGAAPLTADGAGDALPGLHAATASPIARAEIAATTPRARRDDPGRAGTSARAEPTGIIVEVCCDPP